MACLMLAHAGLARKLPDAPKPAPAEILPKSAVVRAPPLLAAALPCAPEDDELEGAITQRYGRGEQEALIARSVDEGWEPPGCRSTPCLPFAQTKGD